MSIVNLMASDIWSEADIVGRTEAVIESVYPRDAVVILNRKVTAAMIGKYTMTAAEDQDVLDYAALCESAAIAGDEARSDMALLNRVLAYEQAVRRLTLSEVTEPATVTVTDEDGVASEQANPAIAVDEDERAIAQLFIDEVGIAVTDLFDLRNPAPVIVEEDTNEEQP